VGEEWDAAGTGRDKRHVASDTPRLRGP